MNQSISHLKINPPLGNLPVLQYCPPGELQVDRAYQRALDQKSSQGLIRRIAQFWDWGLCQPLVVARRDDGALFVVDGQHRLAAAKLRGDIAQLPCVISSYSGAAGEAASFVQLNQQRRPLIALDLFRAALASQDAESLAIMAQIEGAGLTLAPHMTANGWKPGMIGNIGGLQRAARQHGMKVMGRALQVMALAFEDQVLCYAGTIFPGVVATVHAHGERFNLGRMVEILRARSQGLWRRDILIQRAGTGDGLVMAAATVIGAAYRGQTLETLAAAEIAALPVEPELVWCGQCDARVSADHVTACRSPWCKAKKAPA